MDTPAFQGDFTYLSHPDLDAQLQNLEEEMLKILVLSLVKGAGGVKIRLLVRGRVSKAEISFEGPVDFLGVLDALAVGKNQDFEQLDWMILWSATDFVDLLRIERLQTVLFGEIIDGLGDEAFETVVFDSLGEVLREDVRLVLIVSDRVGCHGWNLTQWLAIPS